MGLQAHVTWDTDRLRLRPWGSKPASSVRLSSTLRRRRSLIILAWAFRESVTSGSPTGKSFYYSSSMSDTSDGHGILRSRQLSTTTISRNIPPYLGDIIPGLQSVSTKFSDYWSLTRILNVRWVGGDAKNASKWWRKCPLWHHDIWLVLPFGCLTLRP